MKQTKTSSKSQSSAGVAAEKKLQYILTRKDDFGAKAAILSIIDLLYKRMVAQSQETVRQSMR